MLPARMLLDLLKAPGLCMVCYGNVSSMRHSYGKSFDNTRQHIFLKTDARKFKVTVVAYTPIPHRQIFGFVAESYSVCEDLN